MRPKLLAAAQVRSDTLLTFVTIPPCVYYFLPVPYQPSTSPKPNGTGLTIQNAKKRSSISDSADGASGNSSVVKKARVSEDSISTSDRGGGDGGSDGAVICNGSLSEDGAYHNSGDGVGKRRTINNTAIGNGIAPWHDAGGAADMQVGWCLSARQLSYNFPAEQQLCSHLSDACSRNQLLMSVVVRGVMLVPPHALRGV